MAVPLGESKLLDKLFRYSDDSKDDRFEALVGNHRVLFVKSLPKVPNPIIFLACVIKNELFIIDSVKSEFLTNHLCCFALFRFFSVLKSKNSG